MTASLYRAGVIERSSGLHQAAVRASFNRSKFTMHHTKSHANRKEFKADLGGFSPNAQDTLKNFEPRNQVPSHSQAS
jgi:hypothetical protein